VIGPFTQLQSLALLGLRPSKSSRSYKRRHRAFILWKAEQAGCYGPAIYRRARKVLPLP
jgi:hypothetical protein